MRKKFKGNLLLSRILAINGIEEDVCIKESHDRHFIFLSCAADRDHLKSAGADIGFSRTKARRRSPGILLSFVSIAGGTLEEMEMFVPFGLLVTKNGNPSTFRDC